MVLVNQVSTVVGYYDFHRLRELGFPVCWMISIGLVCPNALERLALGILPEVTWLYSTRFSERTEASGVVCDFIARIGKGLSCEETVFAGRHRSVDGPDDLPPGWPWVDKRAHVSTADLLMLGKCLFERVSEAFAREDVAPEDSMEPPAEMKTLRLMF